jgi:hypothetical protein
MSHVKTPGDETPPKRAEHLSLDMPARIVLLSLLFMAQAFSQTLTVTGPASVAQGQTAAFTVSLTGSSGLNLAGLQWTLATATGQTWGTPTISTCDAALGKGAYCNPAGLCLAVDQSNATPPVLSNNPFADGAVLTIPATFTSTPLGSLSFPLTALLGVSTTAAPITIAAATAFTITVTPSHCDYNGDGAVNDLDVQAIISAIEGPGVCSASFAAGCSLHSLQAVVQAALGGACIL